MDRTLRALRRLKYGIVLVGLSGGVCRAEELRLAGRWPGYRRGVPVSAAVQNRIAYLAMGRAGIDGPTISILQLTDGANPQLTQKLQAKSTRSECIDLDLKGDLLVWTDPVARSVYLHSATNRLNPALVKAFEVRGSYKSLVARILSSNQVAVAVNGLPSAAGVRTLDYDSTRQNWSFSLGAWLFGNPVEESWM